jgi:DNA-binding IclR family transcriptional regulator
MATTKNVRSVERAIGILTSFSRSRPSMDVGELQQLVRLARPTLYRLLNTLENHGLVRSVGEPRRYELGYKVVEMANLWLSEAKIVRVAQPLLEPLWLRTGETVALMIPLSATKRLCAIEYKSRHALSFSYGIGHTGLMYLGASGKAMLAHMPAQQIEIALREATRKGRIETQKVRGELDRIRRNGYAVTEGEVTKGAVAIAAPVFDYTGSIVGSVGLYGPEARLQKSEQRDYVQTVRGVAEEISAALGRRDVGTSDAQVVHFTPRRRKISS